MVDKTWLGPSTETRQTLSREQEADRDLKHSAISPPVAWTLCALFLFTIAAVPILQQTVEISRNLNARREAARTGAALPPLFPQAYDVFGLLPSWQQVRSVHTFWDAWALLPQVKAIREFENNLEQQSVLAQWLLPGTQYVLSNTFGLGNEQAYTGRGQWLMYRPDVEYLTNPAFLNPSVLKMRARSGSSDDPVQPDPLKAILHFKQQLAARGIQLVVMPAPLKPVIAPDLLSARYYLPQGPVQNPSYARFVGELQNAGIPVFDAQSILMQQRLETGNPQFLETDTHWTPQAMEGAAQALADFIQGQVPLPALSSAGYVRKPEEVTNLGDIAVMLKLPESQTLYPAQAVQIQQVFGPDGQLWKPQRDADVLLLGDSFSNIYSLKGMNWGEGAGFAEQLSCDLQRPLDRIVINAGGAFSSRQALLEDMKRGRDRLAGKRLVIYEFAMRDLVSGNWKMLDLPPPPPGETAPPPVPAPGGGSVPGQGPAPASTSLGQGPAPASTSPGQRPTAPGTSPASSSLVATLPGGHASPGGPAAPTGPPPLVGQAATAGGSHSAAPTPRTAAPTPAPGSRPLRVAPRIAAQGAQVSRPGPIRTGRGYSPGSALPGRANPSRLPAPPYAVQPGAPRSSYPHGYRWPQTPRPGSRVTSPVPPSNAGRSQTPPSPTPPASAHPQPAAPRAASLVVQGTVKAIAQTPQPGSVAYKDCIIAIHLTGVKAVRGQIKDGDILVYVWGMKDNRLVQGSTYQVGQTVTLTLTRWEDVEDQYGGYNRRELDSDPDALALDAYWGAAPGS